MIVSNLAMRVAARSLVRISSAKGCSNTKGVARVTNVKFSMIARSLEERRPGKQESKAQALGSSDRSTVL